MHPSSPIIHVSLAEVYSLGTDVKVYFVLGGAGELVEVYALVLPQKHPPTFRIPTSVREPVKGGCSLPSSGATRGFETTRVAAGARRVRALVRARGLRAPYGPRGGERPAAELPGRGSRPGGAGNNGPAERRLAPDARTRPDLRIKRCERNQPLSLHLTFVIRR